MDDQSIEHKDYLNTKLARLCCVALFFPRLFICFEIFPIVLSCPSLARQSNGVRRLGRSLLTDGKSSQSNIFYYGLFGNSLPGRPSRAASPRHHVTVCWGDMSLPDGVSQRTMMLNTCVCTKKKRAH